jgi:LacI family transcriptional regulator
MELLEAPRKNLSSGGFKKEVTLSDVARAVKKSKGTVSMALNGTGRMSPETRERVLEVAKELGFQANPMAQRLAGGPRDNTVAICTSYLDLGVLTHKLKSMQNALIAQGYNTSIHVFGDVQDGPLSEQTLLSNLRRMRPRAIVCNSQVLPIEALDELHRFQDEGGILVSYDLPLDLDCDQVVFDRAENSYTAMRYLLELGHRNVGFSMGPIWGNQERLEGIKRALKEFKVPFHAEWVEHAEDTHCERMDSGVELAKFFLAHPQRPTAMCILNDHVAAGFASYICRHGVRIPDDVSIVGHDNMPISLMCFPASLTTVSHPSDEIARRTTELLLERLDGKASSKARTIEVRGELIVRESTAPLAAS